MKILQELGGLKKNHYFVSNSANLRIGGHKKNLSFFNLTSIFMTCGDYIFPDFTIEIIDNKISHISSSPFLKGGGFQNLLTDLDHS